MFAKIFKLVLLHLITVPTCQVQKVSQPLFEYCPGPAEFSLVAVSMCPGFWSGQVRLSCPAVKPWPWLEQKPPLVHPFNMACWSVALKCFSMCMSSPSGGVCLMLVELRPELLEPRWVFNSCRSILIAVYYVFVSATSCPRTALLLVAADAMLSTSLLKEFMNESAGMAPGGGTWA